MPQLTEPEDRMLLPYVVREADNVNGWRFDANLWDALPPAEAARYADRPAGRRLDRVEPVPAHKFNRVPKATATNPHACKVCSPGGCSAANGQPCGRNGRSNSIVGWVRCFRDPCETPRAGCSTPVATPMSGLFSNSMPRNSRRSGNAGWAGRGDLRGQVVLGFRIPTREGVDQRFSSLTSTGCRGLQPPFDAFWGARYAIVGDPDGIAIGLMSPIDPTRQTAPPKDWIG